MANTINATSGIGIVSTADNTNILNLQTNGTNGLTIDASQNVSFANQLVLGVSGTIRLFKDGNLVGSVANTTNYNSSSYATTVGSKWNGADFFQGNINDVRTSRYGRYVEGTVGNAGKMVFNGTNTLALPTTAFPNL